MARYTFSVRIHCVWLLLTLNTAPAATLQEQADACYRDPLCPLSRASELYTRADDTGGDTDCLRFYYGSGVPRDWPRARRCLERQAGVKTCGALDPNHLLDRYYLATMLLHGQGGPAGPKRAEAALAGCLDSFDAEGLKQRLRSGIPPKVNAAKVDYCAEFAGSTLVMNYCVGAAQGRAEMRLNVAAKGVVPALDPTGRTLFAAATEAFNRFTEADGAAAYECFRGGTFANAAWATQVTADYNQRAAQLEDWSKFHATAMPKARDLAAELTAALGRMENEEARKPLRAAQAAWQQWRDAEVALYRHAFAAQGADAAGRSISATLTTARARNVANLCELH